MLHNLAYASKRTFNFGTISVEFIYFTIYGLGKIFCEKDTYGPYQYICCP